MVSQGLGITALDRGQDRRDRAVQRELDQYASGGRHCPRHRVEEAARAPVQQRAKHDEQQVVGVQARDGGNGRLGRELVVQPAAGQGHQQQDQDRAVFQPLARTRALGWRWQAEGRIDAAGLGITGTARAWRGGVGDHQ
ncbi:hypothetical protein D9M71_319060 [compost metagenome]